MRKIVTTIVVLFLLGLTGVPTLHAQDSEQTVIAGSGGTLVVYVSDSATMKAVPEALVLIRSGSNRYYGFTDSSGKITFGSIPQNYYTLISGKSGYKWKIYYADVYDGYTNTIYLPLVKK